MEEGRSGVDKQRLERYSLTGPENQAAVAAGASGRGLADPGPGPRIAVMRPARLAKLLVKVVDGTVYIEIGQSPGLSR